MAMAMATSALLRSVTRGGSKISTAPPKRSFSSSSGHDDAYEAAKWEKITYVAIVASASLAVWNLSKPHPHFDTPPAYPYLHIRNKEFPWGPDGLFEVKEEHH
ncbi:hypothetical protein ACFE04_002941 [Oxalis oulophora]